MTEAQIERKALRSTALNSTGLTDWLVVWIQEEIRRHTDEQRA